MVRRVWDVVRGAHPLTVTLFFLVMTIGVAVIRLTMHGDYVGVGLIMAGILAVMVALGWEEWHYRQALAINEALVEDE